MNDERRTRALERLSKASRIQVTLAVMINQVVAGQVGVNPTDLQCLNLLTLEGRSTPSQLADALAMTKGGAVTAMIDRLAEAGYVRRVRSDRDRRQVLIEIVRGPEITALMAHYRPLGEVFDSVAARYDADELNFLAEFTERSNAALGFATRDNDTTTSNVAGALATLARLRHNHGTATPGETD
ncbi:MAG TPA: MarR family transcriptional regulator [Pseudonocardiaceae bacterium]|nr:MarR family transcriptional regulator [Pseudonocardiaceae bacterium]